MTRKPQSHIRILIYRAWANANSRTVSYKRLNNRLLSITFQQLALVVLLDDSPTIPQISFFSLPLAQSGIAWIQYLLSTASLLASFHCGTVYALRIKPKEFLSRAKLVSLPTSVTFLNLLTYTIEDKLNIEAGKHVLAIFFNQEFF